MSAGNVQLNKIAVMDSLEGASVPNQFSDHVDSARRAYFISPADRSRTKKNAERPARGPVSEFADLDYFSSRRIELPIDRDLEIDFVSPCVGLGGQRKRGEKRRRGR